MGDLRQKTDFKSNVKRGVAGGLAGMAAKAVVAPVERLKIMFQVTNEPFSVRHLVNGFQTVLRKEGVPGLWKGYSATMLRVFPYAGIQFMTFDYLKKTTMAMNSSECPTLSPPQNFVCGAAAGSISILITYPLDLLRTMMAVERSKKTYVPKASLSMTLRIMLKEEGFLGLYRGLTPTMMGILPYAGIAFSVNEYLKEALKRRGQPPSTVEKLMAGGFAGLLAQSAAYPFEVVRRRMQTDGAVRREAGLGGVLKGDLPGAPKHQAALAQAPTPHSAPQVVIEQQGRVTMTETFVLLVRESGVRGLFKGLSINWLRAPLAISISFTSFDWIKSTLEV
uniref:Mitochondrial carrier protein n=1 Tax=Fibrocapsa japonica TaxID=94617 RepID=A0A7S2V5Q5_9STRA|mmetsp:Transcript_3958/g.5900  ORF Transcript_3958/g.5900 Transcript_3958/m.5900 type:complete len:336 (+) Transcript_3958:174-1181(+)|eukprot:CAMPEP_0113936070 /NCGR_PEP_ID=MMETSP1339-20121228/3057_1 /TAXON_ID=94617 /ORGANISM="Fibrocapsa japonica" /LENGTH=335 /DNA_ID=CAMNT_0000938409 /DNA_START=173 /DNA_END=1180 /DNA_ORIENTATION=- /assembly_acc=CAM_ASM_000762